MASLRETAGSVAHVDDSSAVERVPSRSLSSSVGMELIARCAGRCEFRGCNKFLYAHPLTGENGNFGENAHIVAFRERGARGTEGERPHEINGIGNLMLLCAACHKLVDDNPAKYSRTVLEKYKQEHEARIRRITEVGPEVQTTVLQLKARIGTSIVDIAQAEVFDALQGPVLSSSVPGWHHSI